MALNPGAVGLASEPVHRRWTGDEALLYAVGVGAGSTGELAYTTELNVGTVQQPIPTLAIVLSSPMPMFDGEPPLELWDQIGELDWTNVVHGEQELEVHRPLPVAGELASTTTVTGVYDKVKGAVVALETDAREAETGGRLFTARTSIYVRGAGGWGGDRGPASPAEVPQGHPDHVVRYHTADNQALIYRLSGDRNPLHCDPTVARSAGFDRPILHGLCTYGFSARALLTSLCDHDASRFVSMSGRFSAPVYPGDELSVAVWRSGPASAMFRTTGADGVTVIDAGRFTFAPAGIG
ncbi:MAG: 3-hydroxyacyl-thioester dehydratase HtdY [Acidimicrobiales bacterium]